MAAKTADTIDKTVDRSRNLEPMTDPIAYRQSYDINNVRQPNDLIVYQDGIAANNEWNAGSTVAQNNQSNVGNQSGTSVQWYDGTDGKWNITVWPQNANLNYYQYWDDSNPHQQSQKGWMNDKYTWEGVSNTYLEYNPDITTADLDPNYLYGEAARQQNRKEAWYIARRNDMIASALYNEWRVSKEDVANFLSQQNEWMNSTEADRLNTIDSVWKRLWQIKPKETPTPDEEPQMVYNNDGSGKLYGKNTADTWEPIEWINTLADENSVYTAMNEERNRAVTSMFNLGVDNLAAAKYYSSWTYSEQNWRDFAQTYPQTSALVDQKVKEMKAQDTVNAISNGSTSYMETDIDSKKKADESNKNAMASQYSSSAEETATIKQQIEDSVATNQTASEASKTMENIESEVARLKNRLKNLPNEVKSYFKWDVPDYLYKAAINNRTQEIQNQLSILEDRYNAAYQRYTTELDNSWKQKEYDLKVRQIENQENQQKFSEWYQRQTLKKSNIYTDKNGITRELKEWEDWTLYYEKIEQITQYADSWMKGKWLKNNNPWNIKDNDFWNVIWHDDSGFAIFATPEDWFDALVEKIKFNQTNPNSRYYWKTIREYFRIYAPSSDWNNPDAYANSVAKQLWVSVDTPISELDPVKFASVIAKHDSGYNYDTYWKFRTNVWESDTPYGSTFTDRDYKNFEAFLDANEKTRMSDKEKETLAAQYWRDLEWMTRLANWALENRPQSEDDTWWQQSANNSNVPMTTITLDSWETYEMPTSYFRFIWWPIPSKEKDSDNDKKTILEQINDIYQKWYNVADAMLLFNWIDLTDSYADTARTLFWYIMASGKDPTEWLNASIAYNLKNWNEGLAVSAVENFVFPDDQRNEIIRISALADKISEFIELTSDPNYTKYFWPYDSPINTWFWKKFGNEEATKAYADLWNIYADIRQQLMGSAVTKDEAEIYKPILAESSENLNTVIQKLKSTLQWQMALYNAIRWQFWLPRLDMDSEDFINQVLYPEDRAILYIDNNY